MVNGIWKLGLILVQPQVNYTLVSLSVKNGIDFVTIPTLKSLATGWGNESNSRKRSNGQYFIIKIQGMPGDKQ